VEFSTLLAKRTFPLRHSYNTQKKKHAEEVKMSKTTRYLSFLSFFLSSFSSLSLLSSLLSLLRLFLFPQMKFSTNMKAAAAKSGF